MWDTRSSFLQRHTVIEFTRKTLKYRSITYFICLTMVLFPLSPAPAKTKPPCHWMIRKRISRTQDLYNVPPLIQHPLSILFLWLQDSGKCLTQLDNHYLFLGCSTSQKHTLCISFTALHRQCWYVLPQRDHIEVANQSWLTQLQYTNTGL